MFFLIGALQYGDIRKEIPNPGFFPLLGGSILLLLSLTNLIIALLRPGEEKAERFFPYPFSLKRILLLLSSLILFVVVLDYLGTLITSFVLIVFLLRYLEPQKWWVTVLTAGLVTVVFYLLFVVLLNVQLPKGILFK
jgi:putative tricarboxylic transport membrane protein